MKLRYTRPGLLDLESVLEYVAARSPQGAAKIHSRIAAIIDLLVNNPEIGLRTNDPTHRNCALSVPYLL